MYMSYEAYQLTVTEPAYEYESSNRNEVITGLASNAMEQLFERHRQSDDEARKTISEELLAWSPSDKDEENDKTYDFYARINLTPSREVDSDRYYVPKGTSYEQARILLEAAPHELIIKQESRADYFDWLAEQQ